jgi:hypothetical protein
MFPVPAGGFAGGGAEKTPAGDYSINTFSNPPAGWNPPLDSFSLKQ